MNKELSESNNVVALPKSNNPRSQYFITIPQSGDLVRDLSDKLPPTTYMLSAMEEHEDGSPHLHILIKLRSGLSKAKFLSYLKHKFPDDYKRIDVSIVQKDENMKYVEDYCRKEDPNVFIIGSYGKIKKRPTLKVILKNFKNRDSTEQEDMFQETIDSLPDLYFLSVYRRPKLTIADVKNKFDL